MSASKSATPNSEFKPRVWTPSRVSLAEATREALDLAGSAKRQGFLPNFQEILAKLATSDSIIDFSAPNGDLAAFGSLLLPTSISFGTDSHAKLVYANGLIVEQQYARRGICKRFLELAGHDVDLVLGHTQNRKISNAFGKVFAFVWPSSDRLRLKPEFAKAIGDYLELIGRPRSFDLETGLVSSLYSGPLYAEELSENSHLIPEMASACDGILIIGFNSQEAYEQALEPSGAPETPARVSVVEEIKVGTLDSLVVGRGHAARDHHEPCIRKMRAVDAEIASGRIGIVERNLLVESPHWLPRFAKFSDVDFEPANTVVHVTTGPADRVEVVSDAASYGFKNFILEKPLATCKADLDKLCAIVKDAELKVVVNFPWLGVPLTRRLKAIIDSNVHGKLTQAGMFQTKSRGGLNEASGHDTAFEIETPHQLSLLLHLAGEPAILRDAHCKPMVSDVGAISFMGGASMLLSQSSAITNLRSDLDCPIRERRIELYFEDGWRCTGWYPATGESGRQYLRQFSSSGRLVGEETFSDDPLTSLFRQSYRYFLGLSSQPISTFELAVRTANLISQAKRACGIELEEHMS